MNEIQFICGVELDIQIKPKFLKSTNTEQIKEQRERQFVQQNENPKRRALHLKQAENKNMWQRMTAQQ